VYFDPVEGLDRAGLARLQSERLRAAVERAARSPFYAKRFAQTGLSPESVTSPEDIRKFPLTSKDDLRACYPYGMLTCDRNEIVRMHASSGTTGTPTAVLYTQRDLDTWATLVARCMHTVGMRKGDVFQNIAGYGLFTGGLGIHYGAERLGCLTIPAGAGNTKRQIRLIQDFQVSSLHIIPSYALYFGSVLEKEGIQPKSFPPRIALIGAEPHTDETRRRIEQMLGLRAFNSYGLSEMNGPGVAFECVEQNGMHVWEDAYILEVLDPATQEPVPDGQVGELVLTTLTREAMPIIRYRTRDLTRIVPGQCACGRTHRRIDRISGRADDMLIIKGVNIYPMQIEQVLMAMPEVGQNYLIIIEREGYLDQLRIKVEVNDEHFVEDMRVLRSLQDKIARRLRDEILITPRVDLVQRGSLPLSEGKAKRVQDEREEN